MEESRTKLLKGNPFVTFFERFRPAFHHTADSIPNLLGLQRSPLADHALPVLERHFEDFFRVPIDHDVGIVSDDNHLSPGLDLPDLLHDEVIDQPIVQVVLGLVEHQRFRAIGQNKGQYCCRLLSGRRLFDGAEIPTGPVCTVADL
jgi:hypothetical protein